MRITRAHPALGEQTNLQAGLYAERREIPRFARDDGVLLRPHEQAGSERRRFMLVGALCKVTGDWA